MDNSSHSVPQAQGPLPSETPRDAAPQIRDQTRHPNTFTDGSVKKDDGEDEEDDDFLPDGSVLFHGGVLISTGITPAGSDMPEESRDEVVDRWVSTPEDAGVLTPAGLARLDEFPHEFMDRWLSTLEDAGVLTPAGSDMPEESRDEIMDRWLSTLEDAGVLARVDRTADLNAVIHDVDQAGLAGSRGQCLNERNKYPSVISDSDDFLGAPDDPLEVDRDDEREA